MDALIFFILSPWFLLPQTSFVDHYFGTAIVLTGVIEIILIVGGLALLVRMFRKIAGV